MPNKSIALDSCVVIDYLQGPKGKHPERLPDIEPLIDGANNGEYLIVVSALCIAEVVRANPGGEDMSSVDDNKIRDFFQKSYIEPRPLTRALAHSARSIVRAAIAEGAKKITPQDAVHIATAIESSCEVFYTYDETHMLPHDGRYGSPPLAHPLKIKKPDATAGTLWDKNNGTSPEPAQ